MNQIVRGMPALTFRTAFRRPAPTGVVDQNDFRQRPMSLCTCVLGRRVEAVMQGISAADWHSASAAIGDPGRAVCMGFRPHRPYYLRAI